MKTTWRTLGIILFTACAAEAVAKPAPIPRTANQDFRTEGLFEGGSPVSANIEGVRISEQDGMERWVVDFSDNAKRELGKVAPKFQVRYIQGDKIIGSTGELIMARPAKFILTFRAIRKNFLNKAALQDLVKRSKHVKDIVIYPAIEDGDTAVELILHDNVAFEPHQPIQKEGRLVLDMKETKLAKDDLR